MGHLKSSALKVSGCLRLLWKRVSMMTFPQFPYLPVASKSTSSVDKRPMTWHMVSHGCRICRPNTATHLENRMDNRMSSDRQPTLKNRWKHLWVPRSPNRKEWTRRWGHELSQPEPAVVAVFFSEISVDNGFSKIFYFWFLNLKKKKNRSVCFGGLHKRQPIRTKHVSSSVHNANVHRIQIYHVKISWFPNKFNTIIKCL